MSSSSRRVVTGLIATATLVLTAACSGSPGHHEAKSESEREREAAAAAGLKPMPANAVEKALMIAGTNPDEAARESKEASTLAGQYAEARTAPGVVSSGAYTAAYQQLKSLPTTGGSWADVTRVPYDSDDPRYRDYYSNSSGGAGYVSGRITGIAADKNGAVYAASADGGIWRSLSGGGHWVSISDQLPTLSSGDLTLAADGSLWYASGEANTGGTAYAGAGVFRLASPRTGQFTMADRVGGQELDSTTIGRVRFGGGRVWAATNRGIWSHDDSTSSGAWTFHYAPNMAYMPKITDDAGNVLVPAGSSCTDNTTCGATNAAYKNIVNDIAIDPTNARHVIAALGWRSGDTYNGFYESKDAGKSWTKINPTGAMPADDIGYVTFAWAKDSSKLYAINQSPSLLNKPTGTVNSYLDGIYVSGNGSITGPWNKIATSQKLAGLGLRAEAVGLRQGLRTRHPGLVQPVPHRGPRQPQPRLRRPRGGLRDQQLRQLVDHAGSLLELLLPLLGHQRRQEHLPLVDPPRPARGRDRHGRRGADLLRRQRRRHLQPAGQRQGQLRRPRHRLDLADPRRVDGRAAVLLGGLGRRQGQRGTRDLRRSPGQRRLQPARRPPQRLQHRHQDGLELRW